MVEAGDTADVTRCYSADDLARYRALGGGATRGDEVPEPLIGALFSYLLGVRLPGVGTNYLKQESRFLAPARIGETLTARVRVSRLRPEKHLVDLVTTCTNAAGDLICEGRALVYVRDVGQ